MQLKQITLYVGIIHEKSEEEESIDIFKITTNLSEMLATMEDLENKVKVKKVCKEKSENYFRYTSRNGHLEIEVQYCERIIVVRKGKYGNQTYNQT